MVVLEIKVTSVIITTWLWEVSYILVLVIIIMLPKEDWCLFVVIFFATQLVI